MSSVNFDENIRARLVYDGRGLNIPEELMPEGGMDLVDKRQQLQGSPRERLCELAGRTCYDSLGTGRTSAKYWEHIRQVKHFSVIEHAFITFEIETEDPLDSLVFLNRKGTHVRFYALRSGSSQSFKAQRFTLRVTLNLRAVFEWDAWTDRISANSETVFRANRVGDALYEAAQRITPLILPDRTPRSSRIDPDALHAVLVEPVSAHEQHVSLYLCGSRGFSHEQVRHRFQMSQRSTRYVDEDGSPWVEHPNTSSLLAELKSNKANTPAWQDIPACLDEAKSTARKAYHRLAAALEARALASGLDGQTARKQARGAARGYLGNALMTEMIFTASVFDWHMTLKARLCDAADAEIRVLYANVLQCLKSSQYGGSFSGMTLVPASDGLGSALFSAGTEPL